MLICRFKNIMFIQILSSYRTHLENFREISSSPPSSLELQPHFSREYHPIAALLCHPFMYIRMRTAHVRMYSFEYNTVYVLFEYA